MDSEMTCRQQAAREALSHQLQNCREYTSPSPYRHTPPAYSRVKIVEEENDLDQVGRILPGQKSRNARCTQSNEIDGEGNAIELTSHSRAAPCSSSSRCDRC